MAGISESQMYRYISAENLPGLTALGQIAAVTGVEIDWLIFGDGEATPQEQSPTLSIPNSGNAGDTRRHKQEKITDDLQSRIAALLAEGDLTDPATLYQLGELNKSLETALRALNQLNP